MKNDYTKNMRAEIMAHIKDTEYIATYVKYDKKTKKVYEVYTIDGAGYPLMYHINNKEKRKIHIDDELLYAYHNRGEKLNDKNLALNIYNNHMNFKNKHDLDFFE